MVVAATATPEGSLPLWVTVIGVLVAGMAVPAFQYFTKLREQQAGRGVAEATANRIDSTVVDSVVARLAEENKRLYDRLDILGLQITDLQAELGKRPTRLDLTEQIGKLQAQLMAAGETPVNGPVEPIVPP